MPGAGAIEASDLLFIFYQESRVQMLVTVGSVLRLVFKCWINGTRVSTVLLGSIGRHKSPSMNGSIPV